MTRHTIYDSLSDPINHDEKSVTSRVFCTHLHSGLLAHSILLKELSSSLSQLTSNVAQHASTKTDMSEHSKSPKGNGRVCCIACYQFIHPFLQLPNAVSILYHFEGQIRNVQGQTERSTDSRRFIYFHPVLPYLALRTFQQHEYCNYSVVGQASPRKQNTLKAKMPLTLKHCML